MSWESTLALVAACFVAMATPGPGVFAVISRGLSLGLRRNLFFICGMVLGDLILVVLAVSGLATLASALGELFLLLKFAAAGYLLYLGYKAWTSPARSLEGVEISNEKPWRAWISGTLLTVSNPKAILFYMAFLPVFVDIPALTLETTAEMCGLIGLTLFTVMLGYTLACAGMRRLFRSPRAVKALNRCTGLTMIGTGLVIASR